MAPDEIGVVSTTAIYGEFAVRCNGYVAPLFYTIALDDIRIGLVRGGVKTVFLHIL